MMYADLMTYLPDDILAKVDRAAMSVSLESRVPFLDPAIIEFAMRLPLSLKIRDGTTKWILRQLLYTYVPQKLIDRPKMGFGIPLGEWLRGPLRSWAESVIEGGLAAQKGELDPVAVRGMWNAFLKTDGSGHFGIWTLLMYLGWREKQGALIRAGLGGAVRRSSASLNDLNA